MSEICPKLKVLAKIDFIVFFTLLGVKKPRNIGVQFFSFYDTSKMAAIVMTYLAITWALAYLESRF